MIFGKIAIMLLSLTALADERLPLFKSNSDVDFKYCLDQLNAPYHNPLSPTSGREYQLKISDVKKGIATINVPSPLNQSTQNLHSKKITTFDDGKGNITNFHYSPNKGLSKVYSSTPSTRPNGTKVYKEEAVHFDSSLGTCFPMKIERATSSADDKGKIEHESGDTLFDLELCAEVDDFLKTHRVNLDKCHNSCLQAATNAKELFERLGYKKEVELANNKNVRENFHTSSVSITQAISTNYPKAALYQTAQLCARNSPYPINPERLSAFYESYRKLKRGKEIEEGIRSRVTR